MDDLSSLSIDKIMSFHHSNTYNDKVESLDTSKQNKSVILRKTRS